MHVFVSYSLTDEEILKAVLQAFKRRQIVTYVADRAPQFGSGLSEKIRLAIVRSDVVLAILTKVAANSPSVNQEIGYALAAGIPVLPMVEEGATVGALLQGLEQLRFKRNTLGQACKRATKYAIKIRLRRSTKPELPFEDQLTRLVSKGGLNKALNLRVLDLDTQIQENIVALEMVARAILVMSDKKGSGKWVEVSELLKYVNELPMPAAYIAITKRLLEKCASLGIILYEDDHEKKKYRTTALGRKTLREEIRAIYDMRTDPFYGLIRGTHK